MKAILQLQSEPGEKIEYMLYHLGGLHSSQANIIVLWFDCNHVKGN